MTVETLKLPPITRPTETTTVQTKHGTAMYYNQSNMAVSALASPYLPPTTPDPTEGSGPPPAPRAPLTPAQKKVAAFQSVAAAAGFTGAAATAASTGVNLTQYLSGYYATGGAANVPPALEIQITNNSSTPLVLFNYSAAFAEVSKASQSLFPGESDIVLVTRNKAFSDQDSSVTLFFLIDGITVAVIYNWSASSGMWLVDACIDPIFTNRKLDPGQVNGFPVPVPATPPTSATQLYGAGFLKAGNPLFSFFTSAVNTPSGQIDLDFYDYVQPGLMEMTPPAGNPLTPLKGMENAGKQLASDMSAVLAAKAEKDSQDEIGVADASVLPVVFAGIGAVANAVGALANLGSFGVNLARLISDSNAAASGNQSGVGLEIEITNHMKTPLVLESASLAQKKSPSVPQGGVTNSVLSIAPGESEILLITNGFFNLGDSVITLNLDVCFGTSTAVTSIPVSVTYEWVKQPFPDSKADNRWQPAFQIAGNTAQFDAYLQLFGVTYAPGTAGYPNFSVYTTPVSTQSGQIDLMFYDTAPQS